MALRSRPAKPRPTRLKPNLKGFGDSESPTTHFVGTPIANPSCVGVLSRLPAELGKCTGLGKVGMLLAKHAQHVALIHFPIALFIVGVLFDLLSRGKQGSQLATAAYLNLSVAAVGRTPNIRDGRPRGRFALAGATLTGVILLHFVAASCTVLLVLVSWWMH